MVDEAYEINERCQICCEYTGVREEGTRYCSKCRRTSDLVPIPMTEIYKKGSHLIKLSEIDPWVGRPDMGFG